jgi:hypothetical protein
MKIVTSAGDIEFSTFSGNPTALIWNKLASLAPSMGESFTQRPNETNSHLAMLRLLLLQSIAVPVHRADSLLGPKTFGSQDLWVSRLVGLKTWRAPGGMPPSALKSRQSIYKPGSGRHAGKPVTYKPAYATAIHLGRRLPGASSNLPGRRP